MADYVTVSARIRREMKEEMDRLGIKPSEVIREAIEVSIQKKKMELLKAKLKEAGEILRKVGEEEWVEAVREGREER
jgi:antitoxin component of RelBE/YafQ-DinJ toxin-antitoxin module